MPDQQRNDDPVRLGAAADTGTRIPYGKTAEGQDDTPVKRTYQTAEGEERTETIRASEATFVPNDENRPVVQPPDSLGGEEGER